MNYNEILNVKDITDESGVFEEPVSLEEMKDYLRLDGYVDADESTSDDLSSFDFDDRLLTDLIRGGRELMEKVTGSDYIIKTREVLFTKLSGDMLIWPGPIISVTSLLDRNGDEIESTEYEIHGNYIACICGSYLTITYESGYEILPRALKIDLMRLVAYMYENRGDDAGAAKYASQISGKYRIKPVMY